MSAAVRQIGGIAETRSADGVNYEIRYLVPETQLKSFLPSVGDRASWTPERAYVTHVSRTFLAEGMWNVVIRAHVLHSEDALASYGISRSANEIAEQSFSLASLYFPPEWFGCRIASAADCPPLRLVSGINVPPDGREKYCTLSGSWAKPGDLIANNASPLFFSPGT